MNNSLSKLYNKELSLADIMGMKLQTYYCLLMIPKPEEKTKGGIILEVSKHKIASTPIAIFVKCGPTAFQSKDFGDVGPPKSGDLVGIAVHAGLHYNCEDGNIYIVASDEYVLFSISQINS